MYYINITISLVVLVLRNLRIFMEPMVVVLIYRWSPIMNTCLLMFKSPILYVQPIRKVQHENNSMQLKRVREPKPINMISQHNSNMPHSSLSSWKLQEDVYISTRDLFKHYISQSR